MSDAFLGPQYWDDQSAVFDEEPDHGLRDPLVRQAWTDLLLKNLPTAPARILDIGCGTGSLSVVMASLGHHMTGIDFSPAMIGQAEAKASAHGFPINFQVMDAVRPQFPSGAFDAIVCRHLLWALPEPSAVLADWSRLLTPGGCLFLIEGCWMTGAGLHTEDIVAALPPQMTDVSVQHLSHDAVFWGKEVTDERYAVRAYLPPRTK